MDDEKEKITIGVQIKTGALPGEESLSGKISQAESAHQQFPVAQWDKYEFIEYLGEGGMGRVYKARDRALGRYVALKFIRGDDPELVSRLLQEACAQAKINHDNVCKIYEVGEVENKLYIAMQFIDGKSLSDVQDQLSLEQKIIIMKQVAEGMHAAHRMGLIHRDIKPANIMMERTEDGQWKPYVLDFGLAREQAAAGLTVTGIVIGTPHYMSPEQAQGLVHKLDRRSDIYSMGATFYSVLVGHPPFNLESAIEVLRSLLDQDPVPVRQIDPSIPVDIETIIMKCLEKEPQRRYDSAHALADDLDRYLQGEPITAHRASLTYRLRKKIQKHKALVAVGAIAFIIIIVLSAIGLHTQLKAHQQSALAYQFGQEIKEMESIQRFAYMLPLHDVTREEKILGNRIDLIEKQMKSIGKIGIGPGNYALGRANLILHRIDDAKTYLDKAWQTGYREPEVAYALGRVYGTLYQKKLEKLQRIKDKKLKEAELLKIQKTYRDPALQYLRAGAEVKTEAPAYAEALIAFYERKWDQALTKCAQAINIVPWLYEAKQLEGDIHIAIGDEKRLAGDTANAKKDYNKAGKALEEAIAMAQSDPQNYKKLCRMWNAYMEIETDLGTQQEQVFENTLQACNDALHAKPDDATPYQQKSYAYSQWAEYQTKHGQNPLQTLQNAVIEAQHAIKFNPKDDAGYASLGNAYSSISEYQIAHGKDPREYAMKAISSDQEALKINPSSSATYNDIGIAYSLISDFEMNHGMDPKKSLEESIVYFKKSIEYSPWDAHAYNNIGVSYESMARYLANKGLDFTDTMNQAILNYKKAFELNKAFAISLENICSDYCFRAEYEIAHDKDPRESLNQAIAYAQQAHQISPKSAFALQCMGDAYTILFNSETMHGTYNPETMKQAILNLKTTLTIKPDLFDAFERLMDIYLYQATYKIHKNENPNEALTQAKAVLPKLYEIDKTASGIYIRQGKLMLLEAEWITKNHSPAEKQFETARLAFEKAMRLNSNDINVYINMADYYYWHSLSLISQKKDAHKDIANGLLYINKALQIDPAHTLAKSIQDLLKASHLN